MSDDIPSEEKYAVLPLPTEGSEPNHYPGLRFGVYIVHAHGKMKIAVALCFEESHARYLYKLLVDDDRRKSKRRKKT